MLTFAAVTQPLVGLGLLLKSRSNAGFLDNTGVRIALAAVAFGVSACCLWNLLRILERGRPRQLIRRRSIPHLLMPQRRA